MSRFYLSFCLLALLVFPFSAHAESKPLTPEDNTKACVSLVVKMNETKLSLDQQIAEFSKIMRKYPNRASEVARYQEFLNSKFNAKIAPALKTYVTLNEKYIKLQCSVVNGK